MTQAPIPTDAEAIAYATELLRRFGDYVHGMAISAVPYSDPTARAVTVSFTEEQADEPTIRVDVWNEPHADGSGFYLYGEY